MKNTCYHFLFLLLILTLFSCNSDKKPSIVFSEDNMTEVLVEVHVVEAMARYSHLKDNNQRANMYFNYVLAKNDITLAQLDSSIAWYAKHPDAYIRVYDKVIPQLEKRLENIKLGNTTLPNKSINTIWERKNEYEIAILQNQNLSFRIEENASIRFFVNDEFLLKMQVACTNVPEELQLFMQIKIHYTDGSEALFEKRIVSTSPSLEQLLRVQSDPNKKITYIDGDLCYCPIKIESPIPTDIRIFNIDLVQITNK